jgi:hypothetical protein
METLIATRGMGVVEGRYVRRCNPNPGARTFQIKVH